MVQQGTFVFIYSIFGRIEMEYLECLQQLFFDIHRVSKNLCHFYYLNIYRKHWSILIIFDVRNYETT